MSAVVSLASPLPYSADFRPYLCIHDPAFQALVRDQQRRQREARHTGGCGGGAAAAAVAATAVADGGSGGPAAACPVLLGVTNTHFLTALPSFPSVLSVGEKHGAPAPPSGTSLLYPPNAFRALRRRQQGAAALLTAHSQDLWTATRPLTRPDPALLPHGGGAASPAVARQLRRHFGQLTRAFLAAFSVYFEPRADGTVPRWDPAVFISSLHLPPAAHSQQPAAAAQSSSPAAVAIDPLLAARVHGGLPAVRTLYARFLAGPNFTPWFEAKRAPVAHRVERDPRPIVAAAAAAALGDGGASEAAVQGVAGIEVFIEIEQQLAAAGGGGGAAAGEGGKQQQAAAATNGAGNGVTAAGGSTGGGGSSGGGAAAVQRALERRLMSVFWSLESEDLRLTLVSSAHRRQLLHRVAAEGGPEELRALELLVASLGG